MTRGLVVDPGAFCVEFLGLNFKPINSDSDFGFQIRPGLQRHSEY